MRFRPGPWLVAALLGGAAMPHSSTASRDPHVLVSYDFDRDVPETGPYTLMVFESSRGTVELTSTYRVSGTRSVEIRDMAGDGDFAELQGYFPEQTSGKLRAHFALMTATPDETFNVALAGPAHFTLRENGIGFWLKNRAGVLYHVAGGEERALMEPRAFAWYLVDVTLDIDAGTYELTVREEGESDPSVALRGVPNASGARGSSLLKFSFIGDIPGVDRSDAHFYVDDITIISDRAGAEGPLVAPGRRMLFIDIWDYWRRETYRRPGCPPVLDSLDFGLDAVDLHGLSAGGALERYEALADGRAQTGDREPAEALAPHLEQALAGLWLWREACPDGRSLPAEGAVDLLREAGKLLPRAKLVVMSEVLALAAAQRFPEADELFLSIYADFRDDPRFPSLAARLGLARGDLAEAEAWLARTSEDLPAEYRLPAVRRLWSGQIDRELARELRSELPQNWADHVATALAAEHRYYVLLWQRRHDEARAYAERMVERFGALELPAGRWLERLADAAFYAGDYPGALEAYDRALAHAAPATSVLAKLSDVYFKLGDLDLERAYREKIYGTLDSAADHRDPAPGVRVDPCECPDAR